MGKIHIHRHKWEYLGKDHHKRTKQKRYDMGYISMGSSSETEEMNVTTIRFYCRKCTEIKSVTVDGSVTTKEVMQIQGYDLEQKEDV